MISEYQLKMLRNNFSEKIRMNFISSDDLNDLTNKDIFDLRELWKSERFKENVLYDIYVNPFLLCDDSMLKREPIFSIEAIAGILIKRFNEELIELKNRYQEGAISDNEYHNDYLYFEYLYFRSSLIGQRIKHVYDDDIVKLDSYQKTK